MGVNGEALQLHAVYKKQYFFTARHTRIRIRCNEIKGSYDKIIITTVPSYTRLLPLALLLVLRTHNNTDGNKLVIFSSVRLYY